MPVIAAVVLLLSSFAVVATVLPLWRTSLWWVRLFDFPRLQLAVLAITCLLGILAARPTGSWFDDVVAVALMLATAWQLSWIWRYFPGAPKQIPNARITDAGDQVSFVTANVLQTSRGADQFLAILAATNPHLVLVVEVDEWW